MLAFIDQIEYNFLRFQRITEMHEVLMRTPPPFNVLFVLWDLLVFGCRGLCNLRRKKGFEMRPHTRSLHDTAEGQQHRLVDLYMDAEDAAQNASVDGLLNACRELLLEERANATSRFFEARWFEWRNESYAQQGLQHYLKSCRRAVASSKKRSSQHLLSLRLHLRRILTWNLPLP